MCKDLQKATANVVKQRENCATFASKILEGFEKKLVATTSAHARKAAKKSTNYLQRDDRQV
jgi:hypothetical protein